VVELVVVVFQEMVAQAVQVLSFLGILHQQT
jgi:hypothetical protein